MLRITKIEEDGSSVILKVEGRIMSEGVDVLKLECLKWLDQNEKVQLECSAVSYIDGRGVEMLKSMARNNVRIVRCQAFIHDLLNLARRKP
ncbi:STAS domain-containing protein [Nitrospiraceae bacterium AH_259_D15_M11_P09]|nr:STAS domain-containing protein [Nitrospiraceae bacterium AH_259_D15_M11_P09]